MTPPRARLVRALRRDRSDEGTTMAEMLTVVVILGVVLAIVQGTVILAQKTTNSVTNRKVTSNEAKVAIDAMSRNLRTAVLPQLVAGASCPTCATVAFVQGTATSVQFYANNNDDPLRLGPSKVTYTLTNGVLTERQQKPDPHAADTFVYTYCTPNTTTCVVPDRVLARGITTTKLFTYYDRSGAELTGTSLNATQLAKVDSMDVVVPAVTGATTSTLIQRVTLPNADSLPEPSATAT